MCTYTLFIYFEKLYTNERWAFLISYIKTGNIFNLLIIKFKKDIMFTCLLFIDYIV